jgi:hypothetical protein
MIGLKINMQVMRSNTLTFAVLCIVFWSCKDDKNTESVDALDCTAVHTGTFKYADEQYGEWIVQRTDSVSIETSPDDDLKIYSSVEWITDCEYELHVQDTDNSDNMTVMSSTIRVVITDVTDYGYKCIAYTIDGPEEIEMIRVDE